MKQAFGYLRVSGRGQLDGDGFIRQRETIEKYALSNGITIERWFEEKGICGENELDDRPALQGLIAALYSNGTRLVLIEKLDRLARYSPFRNLSLPISKRTVSRLSQSWSLTYATMIRLVSFYANSWAQSLNTTRK